MRDSDALDSRQRAKYASIIHDETLRLTRLLDDLLDLSVLENGQVSLNIRRERLSDLLDRAVAAAAADEKGACIRIERRAIAEQVVLETDVDRLGQVFINLIANARKYCAARDPVLTVAVTEGAAGLVIDFIDNGAGVSTEAQDVIFEKFSRVGDQKAGGAGLGLAICRQIMARLGGEIRYLPGQGGAAFRVIVPAALDRAAE